MNEFRILVELRRMERGNLKAFADVTIPSELGEITLRGFRVVQKGGEEPWVAFPSSSYTKNGQIINKTIIEVSRGLKRQIVDAVMAEFKRSGAHSNELPV